MAGQLGGQAWHVVGLGNEPIGAQLGARPRHPSADRHPVELLDLSAGESPEPVSDAEHGVAAIQADPHRHTRRSVHSRRRAAGVEHGETQRPLTRLGPARSGLHHRAQQVVRVREAAAAHLHRRVEPPVGDDVTDGSGRRDALHQRRPAQLVAPDADQLRLVTG